MSPLRDRRFVALLAGQAVNGIGSWCALIALWGYAAYRFDANPAQIAVLSLSWSLPAALFGPLAGVPIDRLGPRRALIISDTFAAVVAVTLALTTSFWQLVALGACMGLSRACSDPALSALAPRLVDDDQLLRANALLGAASMSAVAFGPLLAALAIGSWGPRGAFFADAVTYMIGNAVVAPLVLRPLESSRSARRPTVLGDLCNGLRVVRDSVAVRDILGCCWSVYLVWGAYAVIEPLYVRDVLHRPASTFALLQAAFGTVLLLNALVVPRFGDRVASMRTLHVVALISAAAAPLYVGTTRVALAFGGIMVWGAATAWLIAPRDTLLQRATPVEMHGRVLALDSAARSLAHVVALPLAALIVSGAGIRGAAFTFAAMPLIGVLATGGLRLRGPRAENAPCVDSGVVAIVPADH